MARRSNTVWLGLAAAAAVGAGSSCIAVGAFACSGDEACGPDGQCEADGYCSSPDDGCESGRRYSRYAPAGVGGRCVEPLAVAGSTSTSTGPAAAEVESGPTVPQTDSSTSDGAVTGADSTTGSTGEVLADECLPPGRVAAAPTLLYSFCEGDGEVVRSSTEFTLPLRYENPGTTGGMRWVDGGLELYGDFQDTEGLLRSEQLLFETLDRCRDDNAVTLEAWVTPSADQGGGPDAIVSITPPSDYGHDVAIMWGNPEQWSDPGWSYRLRTDADASQVGQAFFYPPEPLQRENHLVLVHQDETDRFYLDGTLIAENEHPGTIADWSRNNDLGLGAPPNASVRNFLGTFHLVAIYCEALSDDDVRTNCEAGPGHDRVGPCR